MILAESYLRIAPTLRETERRALVERLFPIVEVAAREFLTAYEVDRFVEIEVEGGSTKLRSRLRASAIGLLVLVKGYGSIRSGVTGMWHDGKVAAQWISEHVAPQLPASPDVQRRRAPGPDRLRRLFERVASGDLTPEEAAERAEAILNEYRESRDTIAAVMKPLRDEFKGVNPAPKNRDPKPPRRSPPEDRAPSLPAKRLSVFRDPKTGRLIFAES